ncbi:putative spermidine/putrescine transport system permease protein [Stella humosa]|uniref:Putative spermidine/putrescine transport system permease protein n=1 Tax=Stella humosa TaxID=94 RepID=A0A3N1KZ54_9PROT|nr:ABC transporter permease [Stella humosa]ROP83466.1 putative spermidine/putrescine transport system permease protein [Stella humosa]BBK33262.1 polyamine ABC transporter permease [Stella humosa]
MMPRGDRALLLGFRVVCGLVLAFLLLPVLAVIPLSFNAGSFLTYPMAGWSLRWYEDFFGSARWLAASRNSAFIGALATVLATALGTAAALGLDHVGRRSRQVLNALFILPVVVPVVVIGSSLYALMAPLGLTNGYFGLVLAHALLGAPFVVITVSATLRGFDRNLSRAALGLGASPLTAFRMVTLPLILPGVVSGAVFAFATSFDEIVVTLFLAGPQQRTLPLQMFDGVREQISPTITAAATLLFLLSVALVGVVELLRRRTERLRG